MRRMLSARLTRSNERSSLRLAKRPVCDTRAGVAMISRPRLPGTGRRLCSPDAAWMTFGILIVLWAAALFADPATPEPAVARVSLLRGEVRTSVVVDLPDAVGQATEVLSLDDPSFSVEVGPLPRAVCAHKSQAAPGP